MLRKNALCGLVLTLLISSCGYFSSHNETSEGIGVEGLRVNRFSLEAVREMIKLDESTCFTLLKYSSDDADYIYYQGRPIGSERSTGREVMMKVNGKWVTFSEEKRFGERTSGKFEYVNEDEGLILITDFLVQGGSVALTERGSPLAKTAFEIHDEEGKIAEFEPEEGYMKCRDWEKQFEFQ